MKVPAVAICRGVCSLGPGPPIAGEGEVAALGDGFEVELAGMEFQNARLPRHGGLRLSFSPHPNDPPLSDLQAGDEVAVLAQAKRPVVFRDDGGLQRYYG